MPLAVPSQPFNPWAGQGGAEPTYAGQCVTYPRPVFCSYNYACLCTHTSAATNFARQADRGTLGTTGCSSSVLSTTPLAAAPSKLYTDELLVVLFIGDESAPM